ncbi:MAG: BTAD domain-containing putative transcriptional regulator [Gordonia sp. (in: high G+C Gram-positive bacteria)]
MTSGRLRALLVCLTLAHPRAVGVERLIEDVWPDRTPRNPLGALHTQVSRLRVILGADAIDATAGTYRLTLPAPASDLALAESLAAGGVGPADITNTADFADTAGFTDITGDTDLWRGDPGADLLPGALREQLITRARAARAAFIERGWNQRMGYAPGAVATEIAAARRDRPLDEHLAALHMRACIAAGDPNRALRIHAEVSAALANKLGADPGPELISAHTAAIGYSPLPHAPEPPADHFVNGSRILDQLHDATRTGGVVTVVGAGGIGKTRSVIEYIAALAPSDVFFDLSGCRNGDDVAATVAAHLHSGSLYTRTRLDVTDDPATAGAALARIAPTDAVVVLDACERVPEAVGRLVAGLRAQRTDLRVIATSRVLLGISGEIAIRMASLPGSDASELFGHRAHMIRPGADLDPRLVNQLCDRVEGSPLALELAAAQLRYLSLADIVEHLDSRFEILAVPGSGRHHRLGDVVAAGWELLPDDARAALATVAWFPADFLLEDALAHPRVTVHGLATLCDHSMAQVLDSRAAGSETPRTAYHLSETVREFTRARVGENSPARRDIHRSFVSWAVTTLDTVIDDLVAGRVVRASGRLDDTATALLGVIADDARLGTAESTVAARLFPAVAWRWLRTGGHPDTADLARRATHGRHGPEEIIGLICAAACLMILGDHREAARARAAVRRLAAHTSGERGPAVDFAIGVTICPPRQLPRLLATMARCADPVVACAAELVRADVADRRAHVGPSRELALRALVNAERAGHPFLIAVACHRLGRAAAQLGDHARAAVHYDRGADEYAAIGLAEDALRLRIRQALALVADQPARAGALLSTCLAEAGDSRRPYVATAYAAAAQLRLAEDPVAARTLIDDAMGICGPPRDPNTVHLHAVRIGILHTIGAVADAHVAVDTLQAAVLAAPIGADFADLPSLGTVAAAFALVNDDPNGPMAAVARGARYRRDFAVLDLPAGPMTQRTDILRLLRRR